MVSIECLLKAAVWSVQPVSSLLMQGGIRSFSNHISRQGSWDTLVVVGSRECSHHLKQGQASSLLGTWSELLGWLYLYVKIQRTGVPL